MAEGGSVLDFMSMKNYPDMSLDISMLNSLGKDFSVTISVLPPTHCHHLFEGAKCVYNVCVNLPRFFFFLNNSCNITFSDYSSCLLHSGKTVKKEPGNEEGQQHFDDADKLLQEFQEAQVDRVGSRPSSNLSSLSNASERDQHHLGTCGQSKR